MVLAIISSLFLAMASVTGAILAIDAIQEKATIDKVKGFDQLTLAQTIGVLKQNYAEVSELNVNYNGVVTIAAVDNDGNDINGYVNPNTGAYLGITKDKGEFIQWITAFHRSLFLKEPGRFIIGLASFLLMLISLSGLILVIKRQQGVKRFFKKVVKEYAAQYYHVVTGRWMLVPIFIIALTGTYLSMLKFNLFNTAGISANVVNNGKPGKDISVTEMDFFKTTPLKNVVRVEFPFADDDPEEFYNVKLNDGQFTVNQFSGEVIAQENYPSTVFAETLSLDLHTGRTNILWAIVLGLACLNILYFIYSGFAITFKRIGNKFSNKVKANDADVVILVGSENGSTFFFAKAIYEQLTAQGVLCHVAGLNSYQRYEKAKQLLIFTSTYGIGEPPANGKTFVNLLNSVSQPNKIHVAVVGFGSNAYADFCAFAYQVDEQLNAKEWILSKMQVATVDEKSPVQFADWVKKWSDLTGYALSTTPAIYAEKPKKLSTVRVLNRTHVSAEEHTFLLTFSLPKEVKVSSGDLLAIYPKDNHIERLYSIAREGNALKLIVKLHDNGLGSNFLNNLKVGDELNARVVLNKHFHQPKKTNLVLIGNGTGVAPFLGMLNHHHKYSISLYLGFRQATPMVNDHLNALKTAQLANTNLTYQVAFSRAENFCYVMDLIRNDEVAIAQKLANGTVFMICGSLKMLKDVELELNEIAHKYNGCDLVLYKERKQILTDCY